MSILLYLINFATADTFEQCANTFAGSQDVTEKYIDVCRSSVQSELDLLERQITERRSLDLVDYLSVKNDKWIENGFYNTEFIFGVGRGDKKENAVNIALAQIAKQIKADLDSTQNRSNSVTVQDGNEESKISLSTQTKVEVDEDLEDARLIDSVKRKKKVFVLVAYDLVLEDLKQQAGLKNAQIAYLSLASQAAALSHDWSKEQVKTTLKGMRAAKSTIKKQSPDGGDSFKMYLHAVDQKVDATMNCLDFKKVSTNKFSVQCNGEPLVQEKFVLTTDFGYIQKDGYVSDKSGIVSIPNSELFIGDSSQVFLQRKVGSRASSPVQVDMTLTRHYYGNVVVEDQTIKGDKPMAAPETTLSECYALHHKPSSEQNVVITREVTSGLVPLVKTVVSLDSKTLHTSTQPYNDNNVYQPLNLCLQ